jgi:hypothetical protein
LITLAILQKYEHRSLFGHCVVQLCLDESYFRTRTPDGVKGIIDQDPCVQEVSANIGKGERTGSSSTLPRHSGKGHFRGQCHENGVVAVTHRSIVL